MCVVFILLCVMYVLCTVCSEFTVIAYCECVLRVLFITIPYLPRKLDNFELFN